MAYSDVVILETLKDLIAQRGENTIITQGEISAVSGVPIATTQRAIYRLMSRGQLKGVRHIGGNVYTIIPSSTRTTAEQPAGETDLHQSR